MNWATMPETTIDVNGDSGSSEYNIGPSSQIRLQTVINTKSQTTPMQQPTYGELRLRIPPLITLH